MWKAYLTTIDAVRGKTTELFIRNIKGAPFEELSPNDFARVGIKLRVADGKVDPTCNHVHRLTEGSN